MRHVIIRHNFFFSEHVRPDASSAPAAAARAAESQRQSVLRCSAAVRMERYEQIRQLGKGSYGTVFLVRENHGKRRSLVMKKINLQGLGGRERQAAFQEGKLLRELKHPHVVSYHDSFVNRSANQLCLVMTFCEGGDLHR